MANVRTPIARIGPGRPLGLPELGRTGRISEGPPPAAPRTERDRGTMREVTGRVLPSSGRASALAGRTDETQRSRRVSETGGEDATAMPTSVWKSFKFAANLKEPVVLRPLNVSWPIRAILAAVKTVETVSARLFQSRLSPDYNERIVEYAFALRMLGPAVSTMRILDFGCSESILPITLATIGAEVVGADIRDYEFKHPNFSFRKGDFLDAEFPDAHFDAVVAVSSVEHVGLGSYGSRVYGSGDVAVVREFRRILRPEGSLLLTVPFGKRRVDSNQRIYDSKQLSELLAGFSVVDREFYRKASEGSFWRRCSEEESCEAGYDAVGGARGVALLACRRR